MYQRHQIRLLGQALTALSLLLSVAKAAAGTLVVSDTCSLGDAIEAANTDSPVGGCPAGSGADTIHLPSQGVIALTSAAHVDPTLGPSGLPPVTSTITIAGHGATIQRDPAAPDFRILFVDQGDLTIHQATISGGSAVGEVFGSGEGGGILTFLGTLTLDRCKVSGNYAQGLGSALADTYGNTILTETVVSANTGGAAIWSRFGGVLAERSALLDNEDFALSGAAFFEIENSTVSGNGAGIEQVEGGVIVRSSTITGNGGPGISSTYSVSLSRTIVSGNGVEVDAGWVYVDDYNVFGHSGDANVIGFVPGPTDIVPTVPLEAILDPVARPNSGRTPSHLLVAGSPAINASPADAGCLAVDQRGILRPQGAACDVGSVERRVKF